MEYFFKNMSLIFKTKVGAPSKVESFFFKKLLGFSFFGKPKMGASAVDPRHLSALSTLRRPVATSAHLSWRPPRWCRRDGAGAGYQPSSGPGCTSSGGPGRVGRDRWGAPWRACCPAGEKGRGRRGETVSQGGQSFMSIDS